MEPSKSIESLLLTIRDQIALLDSDLAAIYGVSTGRFNEAIKRNLKRFPEDFSFVLTREEFDALISQNAISKPGRGGRTKRREFSLSTVPCKRQISSLATVRSP